jgi:hypothetical protein
LRELLLFPAVYFPIILILRSKQLMLGWQITDETN